MIIISSTNNDNLLAERERSAGELVYEEIDDNAAVRRLKEVSAGYDPLSNNGKRLECYLFFSDLTSLWLFETFGLSSEIEDKVDVFATTIEDLLAKTIFVKLPGISSSFPSLDRLTISRDSETTVHLVIFGSSAQAETMAVNAALVAHYPNYCKDTRLRTRIMYSYPDILNCSKT